jgi:hypothetical protein
VVLSFLWALTNSTASSERKRPIYVYTALTLTIDVVLLWLGSYSLTRTPGI